MSKIEIKLPKREYKKEEYYFVDSEDEKEEEDKFNIDKENELIAQEMFLREGINDEDDIEVGENIINVFKKYNDIYLKKNKICLKENEIEKIDRLKKELDEKKCSLKKVYKKYIPKTKDFQKKKIDKSFKNSVQLFFSFYIFAPLFSIFNLIGIYQAIGIMKSIFEKIKEQILIILKKKY